MMLMFQENPYTHIDYTEYSIHLVILVIIGHEVVQKVTIWLIIRRHCSFVDHNENPNVNRKCAICGKLSGCCKEQLQITAVLLHGLALLCVSLVCYR